jgi:hypothetical protein
MSSNAAVGTGAAETMEPRQERADYEADQAYLTGTFVLEKEL